jgi:hypothetical protein
MAKTNIIPRLKDGRTVIGKVVEKQDERLILENKKGERISLPMIRPFVEALTICEAEQPILEISMEDGDYKIFELDVWPDELSSKE